MSLHSAVKLLEHRPRKQTKAEYIPYEYTKDEDQLRERSRTINRHGTSISIPPTLLRQATCERAPSYVGVKPTILIYNSDTLETPLYTAIKDIRAIRSDECLWIDVPVTQDEVLLTSISERFKIHPLVIADIETTEQRTKLDVFEDAFFLVLKLIYPTRGTDETSIDQICFYMKENILITFQQKPKEIFDPIKNRICQNRGRIRKSKIDYLFYSLFDTIVERYMDVLDGVGIKIEAIEHNLMEKLSRDTLASIYELKREMLFFRGSIVPLKEIIIKLQKEEETQIIQEGTIIYLKDLYDHVVQVNDTIDAYREMLASFIDFYMMINSNGMNEVMKTLTIISTIFIPLTFIVGVYGMNFDNMPEIHWKYGYMGVLVCMVTLTIIMLSCFKKKKWF
ncbi:unnamed protein product [Adineta steineri]|uniref:Magnesium transport protein CorA n=1 Tax=Adineta steineri TaxID=433720 RepID=A0A813MFB2_9BILA|nr:unnamed protein product [Adineta steineri]CAF0835506.1 unnamed protein product [Adineta steineri]